MTGKFTDYCRKKILDHTWGGVEWPVLANLYFTVSVSPSSGYTVGAEANYSARAAVVNNLTNFPSAVNGVKQNGTEILFPDAPSNLGTAIDILIFDTPTPGTGNAIAYFTLPSTRVIQQTDGLVIPAGTLTISFTGSIFSTYLKNAWLDHIFGAIAWNFPSTWNIGYCTDTPTDSVSGTEPAVGGYAQLATPNNTVYFPQIALTGNKTNSQQLEWNEATASQGTATHLVWFAGTNYAARIPITATAINQFSIPKVATNALQVNIV